MALSIQLGFPDVPKSITNPLVNKKDALDVEFPYPFLKFIKLINVSFEPDVLQEYYKEYINSWYILTTGKPDVEGNVIVQQYKDFLRELVLNFTTEEEKIFLSKIDYNDPYDLDVAMGFFGKKLRDITTFYNNKRHNIKASLTKNKTRGTNVGLERYIVELTINHLRNQDDGRILYDYAQIQNELIVEVEELYDKYAFYFNQAPDPRKYDNKDLDYGLDIFLKTNSQLISSLFLQNTSAELISLKEIVPSDPNNPSNNLFDNKRSLTEANVFTNFFFLSTGNTTTNFISGTTIPNTSAVNTSFAYISGQLFESTHDLHAFLNRDWPTSASTEAAVLNTPRQQGFFKPSKLAIVLVDGKTRSFSFNISALDPNSLYFFPDPSIFGKNGEVLTFVVDDTFLKKNITSGKAVNQPTSTPYDTKYYGYVSKIDPNDQKYFDIIFDSGYTKDYKKDIYNNSFALFTNDDLYKRTITIIPEVNTIYQLWNGYTFFDYISGEGFNFDYTFVDETSDPIRTGLSTFTNGFFPEPTVEFEALFGRFLPDIFVLPETIGPIFQQIIFENAYILDSQGPYTETFSSDLSAWGIDPGFYYYSHLIENGIAAGFVRPLLDPLVPSLTADITQFNILSTLSLTGGQFAFIDGDNLGNFHSFDITLNIPSYPQTNVQLAGSEIFNLSTLPVGFDGHLFVKNSNTAKVLPLLETFPYFNTKYSLSVLDELDNTIQKFETAIDVLFLETPNYFVIEKILYENSEFVNPNLNDIVLNINANWANRITNRFKKDTDVFYAIWDTNTPNISSEMVTIFPTIYKYNLLTNSNDIIYNTLTDFFTLSVNPIITNISSTTLTFNSRNNIFRLSYLGKDPSNIPTLVEYDFTYNRGVVTFLRRNVYNFGSGAYTYIFDTVPPSLFFYMQSQDPISIIDSEFVF